MEILLLIGGIFGFLYLRKVYLRTKVECDAESVFESLNSAYADRVGMIESERYHFALLEVFMTEFESDLVKATEATCHILAYAVSTYRVVTFPQISSYAIARILSHRYRRSISDNEAKIISEVVDKLS